MGTSRVLRRVGVWPAWTLVPLVAVLLLVGAAPRPALACSCMPSTDERSFQRADAVFRGEVINYEPPPQQGVVSSMDPVIWTFAVSEVYKGDVHAMQEIVSQSGGASCGLEIPRSGEFFVFAHREGFDVEVGEDQYHAGLCGGTRSVGEGALAVPVNASPPLSTTTTSPRADGEPADAPTEAAASSNDTETSDWNVGRWLGAALVVVVALGFLSLLRRSRTP